MTIFDGLTPEQATEVLARKRDALWYAFGYKDATKGRFDPFPFSDYAADQMAALYKGERSGLKSVQDQFTEWYTTLANPLGPEARKLRVVTE